MKATRQLSAANTKMQVIVVIRLDVQLGQKIAKTSFLLLTNFAADTILGTPYINENSDKFTLKKSVLKPAGSGPVPLEESDSHAACMTDKVKTKQSDSEGEYNEYPSPAVR